MHGKATLVLTDKNTGRVVKEVEESNMITNAMSNIFRIPSLYVCTENSSSYFKGFMPMYKNLLKGIVLLGDTVPEKADNFLAAGKHNIIATAGDEYARSDTKRGSFNSALSGETANGYRFVWDFAPEKAVGTIKSICLTHRFFGNSGSPLLNQFMSSIYVNAYDASGNNSQSIWALSGKGTMFAQIGDTDFYSYDYAADGVIIYKSKIFKESEISVCTTSEMVNISSTKITLPFPGLSATVSHFYNTEEKRFYVIDCQSQDIDNVDYFKIQYAKIDPTGAEEPYFSDTILTDIKFRSGTTAAIFNGKIYISDLYHNIVVCSMSGAAESTLDTGIYDVYKFFVFNGVLACECNAEVGGRHYIYFFDKNPGMFYLGDNGHTMIETSIVKEPYCLAENGPYLFIMLRTDYLATINNLGIPLEKTDQHALQVRYEITNN